jgi:hypothetical protein
MNRMRVTILCAVFMLTLVSAPAFAAASCCDPANAGQNIQSLPPRQSTPAVSPLQGKAGVLTPKPATATSMGSGWNLPKNRGYAAPGRPVNVPSAPSCCSGGNSPVPQQVRKPVAGCGCGSGGSGCQGNQSVIPRGAATRPAGSSAQPQAYQYVNQNNPAFGGTAARPAVWGTWW